MRYRLKAFTILTLSLLLVYPVPGQEFVSDPEVKEIHARISDVDWGISTRQVKLNNNTVPVKSVHFNITIELWNPYSTELTSYGSSSCRWDTSLRLQLPNYNSTTSGVKFCTTDLFPRDYPSGLSNETELMSVNFTNRSSDILPKGNYLFNPSINDFSNMTDIYYGLNMTVSTNGSILYYYHDYPSNWGDILQNKVLGNNHIFLLSTIIIGSLAIFLSKLRKRK